MGLTFEKVLIILVIAVIIVGPDKLPYYAAKLGELVRSFKRMADGAKDRLKEEMGPEFDDVDWKQLDPRQYDPRRIIRDALLEDEREAQAAARKARAMEAAESRRARSAGNPTGSAMAGAGAAAVGATLAGVSMTDDGAAGAEEGAPGAAFYYDDEAT